MHQEYHRKGGPLKVRFPCPECGRSDEVRLPGTRTWQCRFCDAMLDFHRDFDDRLSHCLVCGNPELCVRQIENLHKMYGFTQILCWTRLSGLDNRKVLRSMELMQRHVIPYFKRNSSRAAGDA